MNKLILIIIGLVWANTVLGFAAEYNFPIRIQVSDCNSHYTAHCDARNTLINVTGGPISKALPSNAQAEIYVPIELLGNRANLDLLDNQRLQSNQRCFLNAMLEPHKTYTLQCRRIY